MNGRIRIYQQMRLGGLQGASLLLAAALLAGCASAYDRGMEAKHAGDEGAAETHFRAALNDGSITEQADAKRVLIEMLLERGKSMAKSNPDGARGVYEDVLALDPADNEARLGVARAYMRLNRSEEALQTLDDAAGCRGCERLRAILLFERGQQLFVARDYDGARADFESSLAIRADGMTALAIVETYAATDAGALAVEAMEKALPSISSDDKQAQEKFSQLRRSLVVAAAKQKNQALVDRYMDMRPPGAGGDEWFALQLAIAEASYVQDDADGAIQRLSKLIDESADLMSEARKKEMADALVAMYSIRAAQRLRRGEVAPAENDLTYALRVDPGNEIVKLQRVLAVVALGKLDYAFRMMEKVPGSTSGRKEVLAILFSFRAERQLESGDLPGALKSLELARKAHEDSPETHLVLAMTLAETPVEDLSNGALKELKKRGLVGYPGGRVTRVGEALSELDWARTQAEGLGIRYPWHGPQTEQRMQKLEKRIRAYYQLDVEFQAEATTVLVLHRSKASALTVDVSGPEGFSKRVEIPGKGKVEVSVPDAGLVRLQAGKLRRSLVAEPYTKLTIQL